MFGSSPEKVRILPPRAALLVSFSSADAKTGQVDRLLWRGGHVAKISSAPSYPRDDKFFSGRFIGWNSGLAVFRGDPIAVWPDLRRGSGPTGVVTAMTARPK